MGQSFTIKSQAFILRYCGLSFYWAWVFLSFNFTNLTGQGGLPELITWVHVISALAAMCSFALAVVFYRKLIALPSKKLNLSIMVTMGIAGIGTYMYVAPLLSGIPSVVLAGAALSGLTCSTLVLAWGSAYRDLGARDAVIFTGASFAFAGVLYFLVGHLDSAVAAGVVTLFPLLSGFCVASSLKAQISSAAGTARRRDEIAQALPWTKELKQLFKTALTWRVLIGLLAALFAYGGLRVYFVDIAPAVYGDPLLMTLAILVSALVFLVYGLFISKNSLNLGALYRSAMPLFALGLILIVLFGGENAPAVFFLVSTGSILFEILNWAFWVEVTRTTHFPPVLVFAVGRFTVHLGIILGELVGMAMIDDLGTFAIVAIVLVLISLGFTFTDRDTTFLFEPPTSQELRAIVASGTSSAGEAADQQRLAVEEPADAPSEEAPAADSAFGMQAYIEAVAKRYGLSPRETEVFMLWVTGHGSKYIQDKFVLSEATVKTHVRHIYEKCDVHNRAELMSKLEKR